MLIISDKTIDPETISSSLNPDEIQAKILGIMHTSTNTYNFSSNEELLFVLNMRKNIVKASKMLLRSRIRFRTFDESECNEYFWKRSEEGGFLVKDDIKPTDAINDIFEHGRIYGTECATAIVIVYYKAVLDTFGDNLFNSLFTDIYLMDWQNLDGNLTVINYRKPSDYFPGDCRYFRNPDVDPLTPEWQGENTIDLGDSYYYGHGLGMSTSDGIIHALNAHRKDGSEVSAYLLESCTLPDFKHLFHLFKNT
ncbi:protein-glutamine gamma-glutamyltransferase [Acetivibrio cellulolyticus]|uniref:protein-glutamine gamma-glutamyltransferase n=1 Tax=Acetivibrio cellulolyticus TaxID=35830 RepID=UPI0001E2FBAC|nr:protein-glutamine gamma-glutamyltransferase [Acetivibrio cellulolyticus]